MMSGYFDESCNGRTIVCGGWIAFNSVWDQIIPKWSQRLAYENRISAKHGLRPLTRFHAADCSSRRNEFSDWDEQRQIRLVQKLQDIMVCGEIRTRSHRKPMIFGWGASLQEARDLIPDVSDKRLRRFCYKICVDGCLREIARVMAEFYSHEQITFFHDRGGMATAAREMFDDHIKEHPDRRRNLVAFASIGWEQCVPLQAADMVAYDLFKQIDKRLIGVEDVRKSLQRIVGNNTAIVAGCLKAGGFEEVRAMVEADNRAGLI